MSRGAVALDAADAMGADHGGVGPAGRQVEAVAGAEEELLPGGDEDEG